MLITIRKHSGTALVAAGVVIAALPQGLFNPTGYAAASVVIWATVIAGLVSRALPAGPVSRLAAVGGVCLAGIVALGIASVGWASDHGLAFQQAVRASFYLGLFVLAACTGNRAGRAGWLAGLTVGLGAVSVLALVAYLQPGLLNSGTPDLPGSAGRLAYPIGYWNAAGALLAVATVFLLYAATHASARELRTLALGAVPPTALALWLTSSRGSAVALLIAVVVLVWTAEDRYRQLVCLAVGTLGAIALVVAAEQMHDLTRNGMDAGRRTDGDRMSVITAIVAALTAALAWWTDGWRPRIAIGPRVRIAVGLLALGALVAAVIAVDPAQRFDEFTAAPLVRDGLQVGGNGLSSNGRWQFWGQAVDAFASSPLHGLGLGGYEDWWARHASVPLFVRNPHSLPLQEAAELGVPGVILFIGFVGTLGVAAWRRWGERPRGDAGILIAVAAAGSASAAIDWTWQIPAAFGPAVVCAALLMASARASRLARDGYWLGIGAVATAWIAMVAGGLVLLTNLELSQSRQAAAADRTSDGIARARAAQKVQPWSAEPYTQLALLEEQRGNFSAALTALEKAQDRDSEDWRLWLIEARLQSKRGNRSAAAVAFQRAESLSPLPRATLLRATAG